MTALKGAAHLHPPPHMAIPHQTVLRTLWLIVSYLLRPFGTLSLEILLVRPLTQPVPDVPSALDVTVRTAEEADLGWVTKLYRGEPYLYIGDDVDAASAPAPDVEAYRNRLRRGEECFLAFAGAQIAHVNWLCFRSAEEAIPGHAFLVDPGEAYTTDAFTVSAFRGKNIHAKVLAEMLRTAKAAGCQIAYTVTSIDRRASFGAFRQLGWQVHGQLLCFVPKRGGKIRLLRISGDIKPLLRDRQSDHQFR